MKIDDLTPYDNIDPADLTIEQFGELAKMLSTVSIYRTERDNEFAQYLAELASMMHPEPGCALLKQTQIWITEVRKILSSQSAEVHRILGVPDMDNEPKVMLQ